MILIRGLSRIPWAVGNSLYCYALRISMVLGTDSQERSFRLCSSRLIGLFVSIENVAGQLGSKGNTACFPSVRSLIALPSQYRGSSLLYYTSSVQLLVLVFGDDRSNVCSARRRTEKPRN